MELPVVVQKLTQLEGVNNIAYDPVKGTVLVCVSEECKRRRAVRRARAEADVGVKRTTKTGATFIQKHIHHQLSEFDVRMLLESHATGLSQADCARLMPTFDRKSTDVAARGGDVRKAGVCTTLPYLLNTINSRYKSLIVRNCTTVPVAGTVILQELFDVGERSVKAQIFRDTFRTAALRVVTVLDFSGVGIGVEKHSWEFTNVAHAISMMLLNDAA